MENSTDLLDPSIFHNATNASNDFLFNATSSENILIPHNETFIWDLGATFIAFTLFAVLAGILTVMGFVCLNTNDWQNSPSTPFFASMLLFMISFIMLAAYARQLNINNQFEYRGPMRITDFLVREYVYSYSCSNTGSSSSTSSSTRKTCYKRYATVDMSVDWGYGWACPAAPETQCATRDKPLTYSPCQVKICNRRTCNAKDTDEAILAVTICATQVFDPLAEYEVYEPSMGPSLDKDWPSVTAYGDCETCNASMIIPDPDRLRKMKTAAAVLFFVGLLCLIVAIVGLFMC